MKPTVYGVFAISALCGACATASTSQLAIEAPVVSVAPLVRTVTEKIPHRSCWDETVRIQSSSAGHPAAPTVLGAIIGGVTGGAIGRNNRFQPLLAGAGALLGATVAHDASHKRSTQSEVVTQQRCKVDYELRDKEQITGYRVGYQYGDTIYYTRTRTHPGDSITVQVSLDPLVQ